MGRLPPSVDEPITGRLGSLPGCNPPTNGPEYAPQQPCNTPAISTPEQQFTDMTDKGWEFVGCGKDGGPRTFQGGVYCDVDYQVPDRAPQRHLRQVRHELRWRQFRSLR